MQERDLRGETENWWKWKLLRNKQREWGTSVVTSRGSPSWEMGKVLWTPLTIWNCARHALAFRWLHSLLRRNRDYLKSPEVIQSDYKALWQESHTDSLPRTLGTATWLRRKWLLGKGWLSARLWDSWNFWLSSHHLSTAGEDTYSSAGHWCSSHPSPILFPHIGLLLQLPIAYLSLYVSSSKSHKAKCRFSWLDYCLVADSEVGQVTISGCYVEVTWYLCGDLW